MDFIITKSGRIGFKKDEYLFHTTTKIIPGNNFASFAQIILHTKPKPNGIFIKYMTDAEMLKEANELAEALIKK